VLTGRRWLESSGLLLCADAGALSTSTDVYNSLYSMTHSVQPPRLSALSAAVTAGLLLVTVACSGGESKAKVSSDVACRQSKDSATWRAVVSYAKSSDPSARRFLAAASGDSALPDIGVLALQDRGPTWLFPADSAARAKVRDRLDDGIAITMLVYWHGMKQEGDTAMVIRLSGRYIGTTLDGTVSPAKVYRFKCPADRWVMTDSSVVQQT
jgi:hypothetical protein